MKTKIKTSLKAYKAFLNDLKRENIKPMFEYNKTNFLTLKNY